ncbi:hypothetical protein K8R32_04350 [bacterium]|nr:hypothetical protein [bacterium]
MLTSLIDLEKEFVIVKHSYLNGNNLDIEKTMIECSQLQKFVGQRKVVPCLEADFMDLSDDSEHDIVLTHSNFWRPTKKKFQQLFKKKIARTLSSGLEVVADYKAKNPDKRVIICLEAKSVTSESAIRRTIVKLQEFGLGERDVYFDSFNGLKLDIIRQINQELNTKYLCSWHLLPDGVGTLLSRYSPFRFIFPVGRPINGYDFKTRHIASFRKVHEYHIQGGIGSSEKLKHFSENPLVFGAYYRVKEGNKAIMLLNSTFNFARWRQLHFV